MAQVRKLNIFIVRRYTHEENFELSLVTTSSTVISAHVNLLTHVTWCGTRLELLDDLVQVVIDELLALLSGERNLVQQRFAFLVYSLKIPYQLNCRDLLILYSDSV